MFEMLRGKRTKLAGAGLLVYGIGGLLAGLHDANRAVELVLEGLGFIFMRAALGNGAAAGTKE